MPHISFSALKIWNDCPFKYKLQYIDKIKAFQGNPHTAFGTAMHDVCEQLILGTCTLEESPEQFKKSFIREFKSLPKEVTLNVDKKLIVDMSEQGTNLAPLAIPALEKKFGEFEVISSEEELYEPIPEFEKEDMDFKGFVDLVIKTNDGKYHIIDWKTCSWGWDFKKKTDPMTTYQLTLYKHYLCLKHDLEPKNVETYFALLKRTAKKDRVEIFKVTSGERKTKNALNLLNKALYNIVSDNHVKNRLSCSKCEFYKTKHCT
tara:strand:+ start:2154 stop:2936 length:783 start_codon:yes stop_codon:yes gene_type:complete